ncbi:hypothetical protein D3C72_1782710 [compost metagenome]
MGHGLAARAAEVEELDHRHLGVGGAEAGVARVMGQQGGVGLDRGVDGLDAGLFLIRLARGQDLVQHLRVLDQIGADASAEVAAGQPGRGRQTQRDDRDGQGRAAQRLAGQRRQEAALGGGRRSLSRVGACVVGHEGLGIGRPGGVRCWAG